MANINEQLEIIQWGEIHAKTSLGVQLAAAQLAISLASEEGAATLISARIQEVGEIRDDVDPFALLSDKEQSFLPAARAVVGVLYEAAEASLISLVSHPTSKGELRNRTRLRKGKVSG